MVEPILPTWEQGWRDDEAVLIPRIANHARAIGRNDRRQLFVVAAQGRGVLITHTEFQCIAPSDQVSRATDTNRLSVKNVVAQNNYGSTVQE
jgi:hypothetical protein